MSGHLGAVFLKEVCAVLPKREFHKMKLNQFSKQVIERAEGLRIIDDALWRLIAEQESVCQEILRTFLHDDALIVQSVTAQDTIKSLHREITLDAKCILGDGTICNIEMQKGNANDDIRRVRFHASSLTANHTPKGTEFKDVPAVKILYITEYDALKNGRAVTHVTRCMKSENGYQPIDDGEDIIFANTEIKDGSQESKLLQLFLRTDAFHEELYPNLSKAVNYYKQSEGGKCEMCKSIESYAREYAQEREREFIKKLLIKEPGYSVEEIAAIFSTSVDFVKEVQAELVSLV